MWSSLILSSTEPLDPRFIDALDASFGEPEREIFRRAGKDASFDDLARIPAVLAMCWTKS